MTRFERILASWAATILVAVGPGPVRAAPEAEAAAATPPEVSAAVGRAGRLVDQWRFDEAFAIAEKLYREHPDLPAVQYVAGQAKFLQQDYAGAVALLERATAHLPEDAAADPWLDWARRTRDITEGYAVHRGERFELRVPPGADEVLAPYALEALEAAWQRIGDDFGYHPDRPIVVEAYLTPEALSAASGLPVEAIKTSGTIAICKHNKLMFTSPRSLLRGYEWLDTLAHEYVHYVVSRVSHNRVPVWLHEGLAKYEETRWNREAGGALSPYSERLLAEAVQGKREFVTFADMYPSMALLPSQEHTALAFAEVFSAVEYLVTEKGGYPTLRTLIGELKAGRTDTEAVEAATGLSFDAFEKSWRAWLAKRPLRADADAVGHALTFKEDAEGKVPEGAEDEADAGNGIDDPRAKRHAHLGELLRIRGREQAAVAQYEKAYAVVGPKAPLLSNKLALTLMGLEKFDRAENVLTLARDANPDFVTTHVNLGRLFQRTERWEPAEAAYLRANEINPFDPAIHAGLHAVYQATGDKAGAKREAKAYALVTGADPGQRQAPRLEEETGWLSLSTTPWARVAVDGADTGLTTPLFRLPLAEGTHEVVLTTPDGAEKRLQVEVEAGEESQLVVEL